MGKLKAVLTNENGWVQDVLPTQVAIPKITKADAVSTVANGIKATGQGTVFVAAKTIRTGRGLGKLFASFYNEVAEEMARQDAPSRSDLIIASKPTRFTDN
jgi:hypothetical protein